MNVRQLHALLLLAGLLASCANPDRVLFVTDTSIGLNVDKNPPTASIAYDRIEGYIGPRYENGGVPPVVGSIETGGSVFDPRIRQVYATGAAAVKAVGTPNAADGPAVLTGDPAKKELVFFGTTTTLGLKVGFSGGAYPDSLVIGYKRKEFSLIPLATTTVNNVTTDVYPSVLASIDTTATATSLANTGLTNKQFFATGVAAETLARNPTVSDTFKTISQESVTATLTPAEKAAAMAKAGEQFTQQERNLAMVISAITPNGTFEQAKLAALVDAANAQRPGSVPADLKNATTADAVSTRIRYDQVATASLAQAASGH